MSSLTKEIKAHLALYVGGGMTPQAFQNWFAVTIRVAHESNDSEAEALTNSVEWSFHSLENGAQPEQVRELLAQLADLRTGNRLVFGLPLVFSNHADDSGTSGTSSTLQSSATSGSMGRPRVLSEMVPA